MAVVASAFKRTDGLRRRNAQPSDIPALCELGFEAMENDAYEGLVIDKAKIRSTAMECVSSASSFCRVVEDESGALLGCVAAVTHDQQFYERKQASVVMFYCKAPGHGVALLREFLAWARGRPVIKTIVFTFEANADPRIGKLLKRLGLTETLPVYMETR